VTRVMCPRCRRLTDKLFKVSLEDRGVGELCRACVPALGEFLTSLPAGDGEQRWGEIGAIDGSDLIERFDIGDGLI